MKFGNLPMAKAGAAMAAAPKTEKAAAERKALRDWSAGSAFKAVDDFCMDGAGAKADAAARTERMVMTESFMILYSWLL